MPRCRLPIFLLLALTALTAQAQAWQAEAPRETAPNEYLVVGTVVWAHAGASSIAIRGSGLLGYLRIRVSSYRVKQPSSLLGLRPGDAVTAVFSRRDGMLHRLRRTRGAGGDTH
jgi:Cu/Ag efflux protein CusF